jgi:transcriptional regulator with XRE-family HTH domain
VTELVAALDALPGRVRDTMLRHELTYRDVAAGTGLSVSAVYRLANGVGDPRQSTIVDVARWLDDVG